MIDNVIKGGYCIGCGACTATAGSPFRIRMSSLGCCEAHSSTIGTPKCEVVLASKVCPFSDDAVDETQLAGELFDSQTSHHPAVGRYISCYAGFAAEGRYRESGSSGGLASWLCSEFLRSGMADRVVHVAPVSDPSPYGVLFQYRISSVQAEVMTRSKSRYYPVEMSHVLEAIRNVPGRYVLLGVPCFVKAARLLCRVDPLLRERLCWFVGLVCGHLKSHHFAAHLAWQMGVAPDELIGFDFRVKNPAASAAQYDVEAHGRRRSSEFRVQTPASSLYGSNWSHGFFKYKACDYCDDVIAETADVVIGDAWLPRYVNDPKGTNILVTRRPEIETLLARAVEAGRVTLDPLTAGEIARSQDAGLRHRRDGLHHRLEEARRRGRWTPKKRSFTEMLPLSQVDRARYVLRERIRDESHRAFQIALESRDISLFTRSLRPLTEALDGMRRPLLRRILDRLAR